MALVGEQEGVLGDVLEQGRRRLPGAAPGQIAAVVLDPGAGAGGLQHLEVEAGALLHPLGLEQLAGLGEPGDPRLHLGPDLVDGLLQGRAGGHIVAVGVDLHAGQVGGLLAGQGVELGDGLDLLAEHRDPPGPVLIVGGEDLDHVPPAAEGAPGEGLVVALVLLGHQVGHQPPLVHDLPHGQGEGHGGVGLHRADAIDAGDGGHDNHVIPLQHRPGGGVAHPVDLLVDGAVLLDEGVGPRHIGLGLVVVVVGDEVLHGVVREEGLELPVELGGEGLVRGQNEGRALGGLDQLGHGEGLAGAGDAQEDLIGLAVLDALGQLANGPRLVAGGGVVGDELEPAPALGLFRSLGPVGCPQGGAAQSDIGNQVEGEGLGGLFNARRGAAGGGTCHEQKPYSLSGKSGVPVFPNRQTANEMLEPFRFQWNLKGSGRSEVPIPEGPARLLIRRPSSAPSRSCR